ncbi:CAAX protease self-immunity [Ekhidna lutea]|uniref:CAAX protease self-immunity n=1 Tax=Ekhidna lutea TaxID=447679 RepID=A0A239L2H2_EKHLU|nr:CPBP family intramembrane glutamic endopeptidase [Ekhidna lutea]SNT24766.1 CAAX protease self-immunity [Ekhidna lutea]
MRSINLRRLEIIAVGLTALGKFLFYDVLNQQLIFILIMFIFWGVYITKRIKQSPESLREWGFRIDNFTRVLKTVLPYGIVAIVACVSIGMIRDTINIHWHIIPILLLYPIFGTLQQFLLMALFAGNLESTGRFSKVFIIIITSTLFGLLHYPYWWLVVGTFLLAILYSIIYLRERNLYVLGVFHGWLGAIFYYTVVEKDPFIEVFGWLIRQ